MTRLMEADDEATFSYQADQETRLVHVDRGTCSTEVYFVTSFGDH